VRFSRESYYGLKLLTCMASQPGRLREAADLAAGARVPGPFAAKILQKLARGGIVRSSRGRARGYALASPPSSVTVRSVVEAIDGRDLFQRCVFWSNRCSDARPCPLHELWTQVRPEVASLLDGLTLAQLGEGRRRRA